MNFLILKFFGLFLICLSFFNSFQVANSNEINKLKGEINRLEKLKYELENQLSQRLFTKKIVEIGDEEITKTSKDILNRKIDPFTAVDNIIKE